MNLSRWQVIGGALVAVFAAGLTLYYLLYGFPQPVEHERYVTEQTALRLMLRPAQMQYIVSDAVPEGVKYIPAMPRLSSAMGRPQRMDWLHYLPYELTLLVQLATSGTLEGVLFVNGNEAGPDFAELVSDSRILARPILFPWRPPSLVRDEEDGLVVRGILEPAEEGWDLPGMDALGGPFHLPEPDGGVLVDFAADNAGTVLQMLHHSLQKRHGPLFGDSNADAALVALLERITRTEAKGELVDDETIEFVLEAELTDTAGAFEEFDQLAAALMDFLASRARLACEVYAEPSPQGLRARCRITGIASRLHEQLR